MRGEAADAPGDPGSEPDPRAARQGTRPRRLLAPTRTPAQPWSTPWWPGSRRWSSSCSRPARPPGRGARADPARGHRSGGGDGRQVRAGGALRGLL